jgi:hypothetical protein
MMVHQTPTALAGTDGAGIPEQMFDIHDPFKTCYLEAPQGGQNAHRPQIHRKRPARMIDITTTLLSTLAAIFVCYQAIKLDRTLPWFETKRLYDEAMRKALGKSGTEARQAADHRTGAPPREWPRPAR